MFSGLKQLPPVACFGCSLFSRWPCLGPAHVITSRVSCSLQRRRSIAEPATSEINPEKCYSMQPGFRTQHSLMIVIVNMCYRRMLIVRQSYPLPGILQSLSLKICIDWTSWYLMAEVTGYLIPEIASYVSMNLGVQLSQRRQ